MGVQPGWLQALRYTFSARLRAAACMCKGTLAGPTKLRPFVLKNAQVPCNLSSPFYVCSLACCLGYLGAFATSLGEPASSLHVCITGLFQLRSFGMCLRAEPWYASRDQAAYDSAGAYWCQYVLRRVNMLPHSLQYRFAVPLEVTLRHGPASRRGPVLHGGMDSNLFFCTGQADVERMWLGNTTSCSAPVLASCVTARLIL